MQTDDNRNTPRNLVMCFDGTNNQFGSYNTNIVRLIQVLNRDAQANQKLYYGPGVGTWPEPGYVTAFGKWLSKVYGLAFGSGLTNDVLSAYTFLMNHWEPGDRIFFFGFSRGSYTARVLAALLHTFGLLPQGNDKLLPYTMKLFSSVRSNKQKYWSLCNGFRKTFARQISSDPYEDRRFPIDFMGLWDTVSSVGWIYNPTSYPYTRENPGVRTIRHAVSLDERRCFFRQNVVERNSDRDVKEYWFPGVHSDVGGGYLTEESRLWQLSFEWMLTESKSAGLRLRDDDLRSMLDNSSAKTDPWTDNAHESLTLPWWLAEFWPKKQWRSTGTRLEIGLGRHRHIPNGTQLHQTTLKRIRDIAYVPSNISEQDLTTIRNLPLPLPEYYTIQFSLL